MLPKSHYKQSRWLKALIKKIFGVKSPSYPERYEYDLMRYNHKYGYRYPLDLVYMYVLNSDGTYSKIKEFNHD